MFLRKLSLTKKRRRRTEKNFQHETDYEWLTRIRRQTEHRLSAFEIGKFMGEIRYSIEISDLIDYVRHLEKIQ